MIEESITIDNSHQILLSILSIVCFNNQLIFTECYRLSCGRVAKGRLFSQAHNLWQVYISIQITKYVPTQAAGQRLL